MKITATLRQVNDSIPYLKEIVSKNISYNVGYKLYRLSEKLDKVIEYMRNRITKEINGLGDQEANAKINEVLDIKIEIDAEQINRDEFFNAIPKDLELPPVAFAAIGFIFEEEPEEEAFKVIE